MATDTDNSPPWRFPPEIIQIIAEFCKEKDLANFCLCSRHIYDLLLPLLYRHLVLNDLPSLRLLNTTLMRHRTLSKQVKAVTITRRLLQNHVPGHLVLEQVLLHCRNITAVEVCSTIVGDWFGCWTAIKSRDLVALKCVFQDSLDIPQLLGLLPSLRMLSLDRFESLPTLISESETAPLIPPNEHLTDLRLRDSSFAMDDLGWFFKQCPNLLDLELCLICGDIEPCTFEAMVRTFKEAPSSLSKVHVMECARIPDSLAPDGFLRAMMQHTKNVKVLRTDDVFCDWPFLNSFGHKLEYLGMDCSFSPSEPWHVSRSIDLLLSSLAQGKAIFPNLKVLSLRFWETVWSKDSRKALDMLARSAGVIVHWKTIHVD